MTSHERQRIVDAVDNPPPIHQTWRFASQETPVQQTVGEPSRTDDADPQAWVGSNSYGSAPAAASAAAAAAISDGRTLRAFSTPPAPQPAYEASKDPWHQDPAADPWHQNHAATHNSTSAQGGTSRHSPATAANATPDAQDSSATHSWAEAAAAGTRYASHDASLRPPGMPPMMPYAVCKSMKCTCADDQAAQSHQHQQAQPTAAVEHEPWPNYDVVQKQQYWGSFEHQKSCKKALEASNSMVVDQGAAPVAAPLAHAWGGVSAWSDSGWNSSDDKWVKKPSATGATSHWQRTEGHQDTGKGQWEQAAQQGGARSSPYHCDKVPTPSAEHSMPHTADRGPTPWLADLVSLVDDQLIDIAEHNAPQRQLTEDDFAKAYAAGLKMSALNGFTPAEQSHIIPAAAGWAPGIVSKVLHNLREFRGMGNPLPQTEAPRTPFQQTPWRRQQASPLQAQSPLPITPLPQLPLGNPPQSDPQAQAPSQAVQPGLQPAKQPSAQQPPQQAVPSDFHSTWKGSQQDKDSWNNSGGSWSSSSSWGAGNAGYPSQPINESSFCKVCSCWIYWNSEAWCAPRGTQCSYADLGGQGPLPAPGPACVGGSDQPSLGPLDNPGPLPGFSAHGLNK